jgi:tetratricopeptide (TPR) repeat protein
MITTKRAICCKLTDVLGISTWSACHRLGVAGVVLGAALGLSTVGTARAASPSAEAVAEARRSEARAKFDAGVTAFGQRRYADAVQSFVEADALVPSAPLSFNIARAFERLDNPAAALRWYRDYLRRSPQAPNTAEVQARVSEHAATLAARGVQQITVLTRPDGAALTIDEQAAGPTPVTLELKPGRHRATVHLAGYLDQTTEFVLDAQTPQDLTLSLVARPPAAPAAEGSRGSRGRLANADGDRAPPQKGHRFGPAPWVAIGAGAASMLGALGFELARHSAESAAEKASQLEYQTHFDAMQSRQNTARVLFVVGGGLLITGGVLFFLDRPQRTATHVALSCSGVGCGLSAQGSFQ